MTQETTRRTVPAGVTEALVAAVWRHQLVRPDALRATDGRRVQVVYPGRDGPGAGPDFVGALVVVEGEGLLSGDVEVHLRSADWSAHGHGHDPAYDGVVLHVALEASAGHETRTLGGRLVPTLPLADALSVSLDYLLLEGPPTAPPGEPCAGCIMGRGAEEMGRALDRAGDTRFRAKAARFAAAIACVGPEQALYEGVLTALGYTENADALAETARRMPFATLRGLAQGSPRSERVPAIEALLLGAAGLLPSQRGLALTGEDADYAARLEAAWRERGPRDTRQPLPLRLFRVRPENHPARRLAGAARLVERHLSPGLALALRDAAMTPEPGAATVALDAALRVPAKGYFAARYDLGRPLEGKPALVGPERAGVALVNAALPFLAAWGDLAADRALEERAWELFRSYPGREDNRVLRRMALRRGLADVPLTTARRRQGLLHLAKGGCCARCP